MEKPSRPFVFRVTSLAVVAIFSLAATGCAHGKRFLASAGDQTGPAEVAPGYQIQLSCVSDKNLNGKYQIDFDGDLKLPYEVVIPTRGLDFAGLQSRIVEAYRPFFKSVPAIRVTIVEKMLWVQVRGLVEKPGRFQVKENTTLDEILGMAGGLQKSGESKNSANQAQYIKIEQPGNSLTIKLADYYSGIDRGLIPSWKGGDQIFFQSEKDDTATGTPLYDSGDVTLIGEVRTPGEYRFKSGEDFYHYLKKAGGPTAQADLSKIEIVRGPASRRKSDSFDLDDVSDVPVLQVNDLVIVHAQKPASNFFPTLLAIMNTILLALALHI